MDEDLKTYLAEIEKIPKLSEDEESTLARKIQEHGDEQAKTDLAKANLWIVIPVAKKYESVSPNVHLLEIIKEGNVGLFKAAEKYDPTKGFRFSTYATWWVRQAIVRSLNLQEE